MSSNKIQIWKKGSATTIFGVFIMILTTAMCMYFVQNFQIQQNGQSAQLTVDSIADATAIYTANNAADYDDALQYAKNLQELIKTTTGTTTTDIALDKEDFEEEQLANVSLNIQGKTINVTNDFSGNNIQNNSSNMIYKIKTHAITRFQSLGLKNFQSTLQWLTEAAPYAFYSNTQRTSYTEDGHIKSADCSSMCYMAYLHMGFENIGPPWTTETMIRTYFYQISPVELKPGDCIVAPNGSFEGEEYGHAMLYVGNGQCFEMGGQSEGLGYLPMPALAPEHTTPGYHCYRIKPEYSPES